MARTHSATRGAPLSLRWFQKLILAGAGLLAALLAVEAAARPLHLLPTLSDAEARAFARRVGWLQEPYSRFSYRPVGEDTAQDVRLNKLGFRGDDIPAEARPGQSRVELLGDSYTAAWEVPLGARWSDWLARRLGDAYSVANLGYPGLGTAREYLLFEAYGASLKPRVVVLALFAENDVHDNALALWQDPAALADNQPFFTLEQGDLVEHAWRFRDRTHAYESAPWPNKLLGWLDAHSVTYRAARAAVDWACARVSGAGDDGRQEVPSAAADTLPAPLEVFFTEPDARWEQAWRLTDALLAQLQAAVQAAGGQLVVALIPPHMVIQPEDWVYAAQLDAAGRPWDALFPQQQMLALLEGLGIPTLNPTEAFRSLRDRTHADLFLRQDKHFTEAGNCAFGVLLANWLVEQGFVEAVALTDPIDPISACGLG